MSQTEVAKFTNEETNMEATVLSRSDGFAVVLTDLDSGGIVPAINIFPLSLTDAKERAIAKAREIAQVAS